MKIVYKFVHFTAEVLNILDELFDLYQGKVIVLTYTVGLLSTNILNIRRK